MKWDDNGNISFEKYFKRNIRYTKTYFYDKNGIKAKEVFTETNLEDFSNSRKIINYINGKKVKEVLYNRNGKVETIFYKDGVPTRYKSPRR